MNKQRCGNHPRPGLVERFKRQPRESATTLVLAVAFFLSAGCTTPQPSSGAVARHNLNQAYELAAKGQADHSLQALRAAVSILESDPVARSEVKRTMGMTIAYCRLMLAENLANRHDFAEARNQIVRAIAFAADEDSFGFEYYQAKAHQLLGDTYFFGEKDYDVANEIYRKALHYWDTNPTMVRGRMGETYKDSERAAIYHKLAWIERNFGDADKADEYNRQFKRREHAISDWQEWVNSGGIAREAEEIQASRQTVVSSPVDLGQGRGSMGSQAGSSGGNSGFWDALADVTPAALSAAGSTLQTGSGEYAATGQALEGLAGAARADSDAEALSAGLATGAAAVETQQMDAGTATSAAAIIPETFSDGSPGSDEIALKAPPSGQAPFDASLELTPGDMVASSRKAEAFADRYFGEHDGQLKAMCMAAHLHWMQYKWMVREYNSGSIDFSEYDIEKVHETFLATFRNYDRFYSL